MELARDIVVEQLIGCPLGAAVVCCAEGLSHDALEDPQVLFSLARWGFADVQAWRTGRDELVASALATASGLRDVAEFPVDRSPWMWQELNADEQEWLGTAAVEQSIGRRADARSGSAVPFLTSTVRHGVSSLRHAVCDGHSHYDFVPPLKRIKVRPQASARVAEINGPSDWHSLAVRHPRRIDDTARPEFAGVIEPDLASVKTEFDLVHISFLGWLTSFELVWAEGSEATSAYVERSVMRSIDAEMTIWLSDVVDSSEPLPDVDQPDEPSVLRTHRPGLAASGRGAKRARGRASASAGMARVHARFPETVAPTSTVSCPSAAGTGPWSELVEIEDPRSRSGR